MAKVLVQAAGGALKAAEVTTVGEARLFLGLPENYQAQVNGDVEDESYTLADQDMVTFSVKTKGN